MHLMKRRHGAQTSSEKQKLDKRQKGVDALTASLKGKNEDWWVFSSTQSSQADLQDGVSAKPAGSLISSVTSESCARLRRDERICVPPTVL